MNGTERNAWNDLTDPSNGTAHVFLSAHRAGNDAQTNADLHLDLQYDIARAITGPTPAARARSCNGVYGGESESSLYVVLPIDNEDATQAQIAIIIEIAAKYGQESILIARRDHIQGPLRARLHFLSDGNDVELGRLAFVPVSEAQSNYSDAYTTFGQDPAFALVAVENGAGAEASAIAA